MACSYSSQSGNILVLFSKEPENLSGEDSRNDDGSRGDLSTASDDVNANNATVSTTLGPFLQPRHVSSHPQEVLLPWGTLSHCVFCCSLLHVLSPIILSSSLLTPMLQTEPPMPLCLWLVV